MSLQRSPHVTAREDRNASPFDIAAATEALAQRLAASAVERDRQGGHAAREREWVRESGLLALTIPREYDGLGGDWPSLFRTVRRLAQADSALAHLFGFHHLQVGTGPVVPSGRGGLRDLFAFYGPAARHAQAAARARSGAAHRR